MTNLDKLHVASLDEATFFPDGTLTTTGGRKGATHEYPLPDDRGNQIRFFEDLGTSLDTFEIPAIVTSDNQRDTLRTVLNRPGIKRLSHPFYGNINVTNQTYTTSQSLSELGIARFNMTFEASQASIFPTEGGNNISQINDIANTTAINIFNDFSNIFNVSRNTANNFTDAELKLNQVVIELQSASDSISQTTDILSDFQSSLDSFQVNIRSNIFNPDRLSAQLLGVFDNFNQIATIPRDQFNVLSQLFRFGENDTEIQPTTLQRIERINNRKIINSVMRTESVTQAYNVATGINYETDVDLNNFKDSLEAQYQLVIADNNLSDETLENLQELRNQFRVFYESELLNVYKISVIQTHEIPMTILAFNYYGDTDRVDQLLNLNNTRSPSFVDGEVRILTK